MNLKLMQDICNTPGVSGFEDPIQSIVRANLEESCDEVHIDRMGNVIGRKNSVLETDSSKNPVRVLIAAHADEIGMMVRHIDDQGYIHVNQLGGLDTASIVSQVVVIHGREDIQGVIAPGASIKDNKIDLADIRIDTGLSVKEVKRLVEPGNIISFAQSLMQLSDNILMARNFDDRMGTYCLLEALRRTGPTEADIFAVSSTQEEVGVRGIETAAHAIQPTVGLAIDGSMPRAAHISDSDRTCELGEGVGIYIADRLTIGSPPLVKFLFELGKKYDIACQKNIGGGTDACKIQRMGSGCLCTTVGTPTRYMHSTVQLCHTDDIESTIDLLVRFMQHAHELGDVIR